MVGGLPNPVCWAAFVAFAPFTGVTNITPRPASSVRRASTISRLAPASASLSSLSAAPPARSWIVAAQTSTFAAFSPAFAGFADFRAFAFAAMASSSGERDWIIYSHPAVMGNARLPAIDVAPVSDRKHEHHELAILQLADHAEIADAVAPQPGKIGLQCLSPVAR